MLAVQQYVNIIKNMKKLLVLFLGIVTLFNFGTAVALSPSNIVISAIQTESATSASEEYITVHNSGAGLIDVSGWRLQYFSATTTTFTSPTRTITLSGTLAPNTDLTVSSTGYTTQNSTIFFAATLSATGGHIRLVSGTTPNEVVHDLVGWGTAQHPEQTAADVVARGKAYKRAVVNGQPVDTDNNKDDFSEPTAIVVQPPAGDTQQQTDTTQQQTQTTSSGYEGLIITELLPDPAAPLTDASDEFIELYNDTPAAINLEGLTLQTGTNNTYSYKLTGTLGAHNYLVLYSAQTKLTLSNSTGRAQIIDASGALVDETALYETAPTGSSWQLYNNEWSWSNTPTPNATNPAPPAGTVTTPKVKAATTKAAAKTKTTAAKTTKSATSGGQAQAGTNGGVAAAQPGSVNKTVLAGVGILALGYVLYEYRYDIAQRYRQLKSNRAAR